MTTLSDENIHSAATAALPDANPFDTRYEYTYTQVLSFGRAIEAKVIAAHEQARGQPEDLLNKIDEYATFRIVAHRHAHRCESASYIFASAQADAILKEIRAALAGAGESK